LTVPLIVMSNPTVVFDPYAAAEQRDIVQTIVDNYNIASTGRAEWYPVAFFLKNENGEILGGLLGDIWAAWLSTLQGQTGPVFVWGFWSAIYVRKDGAWKILMLTLSEHPAPVAETK
jgi:hypothetical protein